MCKYRDVVDFAIFAREVVSLVVSAKLHDLDVRTCAMPDIGIVVSSCVKACAVAKGAGNTHPIPLNPVSQRDAIRGLPKWMKFSVPTQFH